MFVCRYVVPPGECYYNTIMLQLFFIMECGIARFLGTMRVFEVWASSSSPRLPLCQISFFRVAVAELALGEKSRTQSLTHSVTQSAHLMPREPKLSLRNNFYSNSILTVQ